MSRASAVPSQVSNLFYVEERVFGRYLNCLAPDDINYPTTVSGGYPNAIIEAYAQKYGFLNDAKLVGDEFQEAVYDHQSGKCIRPRIEEGRCLKGNLLRRDLRDHTKAVGFLYCPADDTDLRRNIPESSPNRALVKMFNEFKEDAGLKNLRIFCPVMINANHWIMCEIFLTKQDDGRIVVNRHYYDPLYKTQVNPQHDSMVIACAMAAFPSEIDLAKSMSFVHDGKKQSDGISCCMVSCWYVGQRLAGDGKEDSIGGDIGVGEVKFPRDAKELRLEQMRLRQEYPQKLLAIYLNDTAWQIYRTHTRRIDQAKFNEVMLRSLSRGSVDEDESGEEAGAGGFQAGAGSSFRPRRQKSNEVEEEIEAESLITQGIIELLMPDDDSLRESETAASLREFFMSDEFGAAIGEIAKGGAKGGAKSEVIGILLAVIDSYFQKSSEDFDGKWLAYLAKNVTKEIFTSSENEEKADVEEEAGDIIEKIKDRDIFQKKHDRLMTIIDYLWYERPNDRDFQRNLSRFESEYLARKLACLDEHSFDHEKVFLSSESFREGSVDRLIWSLFEQDSSAEFPADAEVDWGSEFENLKTEFQKEKKDDLEKLHQYLSKSLEDITDEEKPTAFENACRILYAAMLEKNDKEKKPERPESQAKGSSGTRNAALSQSVSKPSSSGRLASSAATSVSMPDLIPDREGSSSYILSKESFKKLFSKLTPAEVDRTEAVTAGYMNAVTESCVRMQGFKSRAPVGKRAVTESLLRIKEEYPQRAVGLLLHHGDGLSEDAWKGDLKKMLEEFRDSSTLKTAQIFRHFQTGEEFRRHWVTCEIFVGKEDGGAITVNTHYFESSENKQHMQSQKVTDMESAIRGVVREVLPSAPGARFDHDSRKQSDKTSCGPISCWAVGQRLRGSGLEQSIDDDIGKDSDLFPKGVRALRLKQMRLLELYLSDSPMLSGYLKCDPYDSVYKSSALPRSKAVAEKMVVELRIKEDVESKELNDYIDGAEEFAVSQWPPEAPVVAGAGAGQPLTTHGKVITFFTNQGGATTTLILQALTVQGVSDVIDNFKVSDTEEDFKAALEAAFAAGSETCEGFEKEVKEVIWKAVTDFARGNGSRGGGGVAVINAAVESLSKAMQQKGKSADGRESQASSDGEDEYESANQGEKQETFESFSDAVPGQVEEGAAAGVVSERVEEKYAKTEDPEFAERLRREFSSADSVADSVPSSSVAEPQAVTVKMYQMQKAQFEKTIWKDADRGGKFRVLGNELADEEVESLLLIALINAVKKSGIDPKEAIRVCEYAANKGGISYVYNPNTGTYEENKDAAVTDDWANLSAIFQDECIDLGLFTGRKEPYRIDGMRLIFLPENVREDFGGRVEACAKSDDLGLTEEESRLCTVREKYMAAVLHEHNLPRGIAV